MSKKAAEFVKVFTKRKLMLYVFLIFLCLALISFCIFRILCVSLLSGEVLPEVAQRYYNDLHNKVETGVSMQDVIRLFGRPAFTKKSDDSATICVWVFYRVSLPMKVEIFECRLTFSDKKNNLLFLSGGIIYKNGWKGLVLMCDYLRVVLAKE